MTDISQTVLFPPHLQHTTHLRQKTAHMTRFFDFSRNRSDFHASAENFRVGVRSLAQKVLIVGGNGEEGGIYAGEFPAEANDLVAAQIYGHMYLFFEIIGDRLFHGRNVAVLSDHVEMIDRIFGK